MVEIGFSAIISFPIVFTLWVFILSAFTHLCLLLVGGAKQPFETTFRVICYCAGATSPLLAIPFCGSLLSLVWSLVVKVMGLAKAHEIQTGRALTAVLLPLICCCAFLVAAIFAAVALGLAQGGH